MARERRRRRWTAGEAPDPSARSSNRGVLAPVLARKRRGRGGGRRFTAAAATREAPWRQREARRRCEAAARRRSRAAAVTGGARARRRAVGAGGIWEWGAEARARAEISAQRAQRVFPARVNRRWRSSARDSANKARWIFFLGARYFGAAAGETKTRRGAVY
jgi:hypothetical protein